MRVPLSWLSEFVPLEVDPADEHAVRGLGREFDRLGLVVEGIEHHGTGLAGIVLARVATIEPIAGADRIRLVRADAGKDELVEVVCGAHNFEVGDVVPFAPVGATLPGGLSIERRKMRGVVSNGMLCSGRELGLSDDHEGLLIVARTGAADGPLPSGLTLGSPFAEWAGIVPDVVFDLAIEPNRPDALSIVGVARDLAAALGRPLRTKRPVVPESEPPAAELATVEVSEPELCPRLVARVMTGIVDVQSPSEVRRRLELSGMRPINAVVDASNYVMLELGQPTHPYDLDRLGAPGLRVRLARSGERLVTLDGTDRELRPGVDGDLVICDGADRPVGLAGVMGGESSEIGPQTASVLLEVASFAPIAVGRSAAAHGLRTEASVRFWRGVDPDGLELAADRFCELVAAAQREAGCPPPAVARGVLASSPKAPSARSVELRVGRLAQYLGVSLGATEIAALLSPLGFACDAEGDRLVVKIPGFRPDVSLEVDLIEEVARHYGYDRIPPAPLRSPQVGRRTERQELRRALRRLFSALGANEAWTSSIVDPDVERGLGSDTVPVELANPVVSAERALRTGLMGGMLVALRHNESHRNPFLRLFEIGAVFASRGDERPAERELAAVLFGADGDDARQAVAALWGLVDGLGLDADQFDLVAIGADEGAGPDGLGAGLHPTRAARVVVGGSTVAVVGEVDPARGAHLGLAPRRLGWLALDLDALSTTRHRDPAVRPVSRFPSADVDLSFEVDDSVSALVLRRAIEQAGAELCESVRLIDHYRGPGISTGRRSLTFRVRFVAPDRTLSEREIADARASLIGAIEGAFPARLRA